MLLKVSERLLENLGILSEVPDTLVASLTQQSAHFASVVMMVDGEATNLASPGENLLGLTADSTDAVLFFEHLIVVIKSDAVFLHQTVFSMIFGRLCSKFFAVFSVVLSLFFLLKPFGCLLTASPFNGTDI